MLVAISMSRSLLLAFLLACLCVFDINASLTINRTRPIEKRFNPPAQFQGSIEC